MLKRRLVLSISAAIVGSLLVTSCGEDSRGLEFMPDMYRGPAIETHQPIGDSGLTSVRMPVKGTIPRGFRAYDEYSADQAGYDSARVSLRMPSDIPRDEKSMEEAAELYMIFCGQCHGEKGDGQGILVKNGVYLGVPNYADRDINMGTIFHVITYGKGVMGSHASQLTPDERWLVTQHVVKLKNAMGGTTVIETVAADADTSVAVTEITN